VQDLIISLITVCYNAESTIDRCINSVLAQNNKNLQFIIIDGCSTDNTLKIINQYQQHISLLLSEPDKGIYDAINKGIKLADGQIIGLLNADDYFADENILSDVAIAFKEHNVSIIYGDIDYVNQQGKITRQWRSGLYREGLFNWGWMPPHPTFYCRKSLFYQLGFYSLEYGTAADYELMLRFMHRNKTKAFYVEKIMVKMQTGGASNKNLGNRIRAFFSDFRAMKKNNILLPLVALVFKPVRKISQYF